METTTSPISFGSFRGLNTKLSEISISPREASSLQNVELTRETIDVRAGNDLFSTTQLQEGGVAKAVTGIFQGVISSNVYQVITGGTKVYSMSSGGVLTDITDVLVLSDSPNYLFSFERFKNSSGNDILVMANGVNPPIKWTGSGDAAALGGTPPANFKHLLVRKNRLYGSSGEFVYHSALLNGESWDALNWVNKFSTKGLYTNEVTGLVEYGDNIAIFKEDGIFLFSGENFTDGYTQRVVTGDGCMSGYSPVEILSRRYGNIIIFVNRNNELKGFNGTKDLISISDPIDNTLRGFVQSRSKYVSAVNYRSKNQYYSAFTSSGTTHNKIIAYDYYLDAVDPAQDVPESTMLVHDGIKANCLAVMDVDGSEKLYSGTYDGWVLKHGSSDTDILRAAEIKNDGLGCSRTSNIVTITTFAPHGFSVGETVIISGTFLVSGATSFDGTFTILSVPTNDTFTYAQTAGDGTGDSGVAKQTISISAHWQSRKESFGSAAKQKLLNDFNHVTNPSSLGQIKTTVVTESGQGEKTSTVSPTGSAFGSSSIFGVATFGGGGITYTRVEFDMGLSLNPLYGRYFKVRFDNVSGNRFSLEEYIMGITDEGYQAEYAA